MTTLAKRKTRLTLETAESIRGRNIIVEVSAFTAALRQKGTRTRYEISWSGIYWAAAKIAADRLRAERKQKKEGREKS